jgi:two-component system response regulator RegX3
MRIALLEDDPNQAAFMRELLERADHLVHPFASGRALLTNLSRESYDLLILDWQVPDLSGYQVLRAVRTQFGATTPVLFVTHRDAEEDIVQALEAGADDYVVKPPRPQELTARVNALLRRRRGEGERELIDYPPYCIDVQGRTVTIGGRDVQLTQKEFDLALFLFRNVGKLLSRAHILEAVWGRGPDIGTRAVDTHLSRLRSRLAIGPANGLRFAPVYGYGYRLEPVTTKDA